MLERELYFASYFICRGPIRAGWTMGRIRDSSQVSEPETKQACYFILLNLILLNHIAKNNLATNEFSDISLIASFFLFFFVFFSYFLVNIV